MAMTAKQFLTAELQRRQNGAAHVQEQMDAHNAEVDRCVLAARELKLEIASLEAAIEKL